MTWEPMGKHQGQSRGQEEGERFFFVAGKQGKQMLPKLVWILSLGFKDISVWYQTMG